ncbi:MAG TPA: phage tail protein [Gaiellaceae bacterium]|nr:phage tail protein [Gaiellaceae bacterium]
MAETDGNRASSDVPQFFTILGQDRRLFRTRSLRVPEIAEPGDGNGDGPPRHRPDPPPVASMRRLYRDRLPAMYRQDDDFGVRFVGALEGALDPILALLDSLPAHLDPDLAPQDLLELLGGWLGVELDESWPDERRRELVRRAGELSRLRGTRAGLELALEVAFPDLPLRVEDNGGVTYGDAVGSERRAQASGFVVYCDRPLEEDALVSIARVIEQVKPVHVLYRLRVKAPSAH